MEITVFQRIQEGVAKKSHNLSDWMASAPEEEQCCRLGPVSEQQAEAHLQSLEHVGEAAAEGLLGICQVCHEMVNPRLLEMDYTARVCLEHLSAPEREQLEEELAFSQVVQQAWLPQQAPQIPGLSLAAFARPAQIVSGDYFDFLEFQDGAPGLAIADAMGHGVAASLIITSLQTALRTLAPESRTPAEVLKRVNRFYLHNSHFTTFVTAFLAKYEPEKGALTYCNAGHNPPAWYRRRTGGVEWLAPNGAAIGLVEENQLGMETIWLEEGDVVLLYTDGLTEASNPQGEPFGTAGLARALAQSAGLESASLLQAMRQVLGEFRQDAPLNDDVTMVAIRAGA